MNKYFLLKYAVVSTYYFNFALASKVKTVPISDTSFNHLITIELIATWKVKNLCDQFLKNTYLRTYGNVFIILIVLKN